MKTKLLVLAVASTLALSAQVNASYDSGFNWNSGGNSDKSTWSSNTGSSSTPSSSVSKPSSTSSTSTAKKISNWLASSSKKSGKDVGIVKGVLSISGISRNADTSNLVDPAFAKTSRPCPPFCIQPTHPFAPAAVETVTELDVIHAARDSANGDASVLVIDARTPGWVKKGTIPHSINVPFTKLNSKALAKNPMAVVEILTSKFGVVDMDGVLNYDDAKTLYLFCNGSWCGQSPAAIRALLTMGYPQSKIKYYRGGMNDWKLLGLTVK
jgi:rhodanese-related sulfurtransferase